jgi:acetyltransferase-like isoleucine patch superfamily enzyme
MLAKLLGRYISQAKGQKYEIDNRIPDDYLFKLVVERIFMKIRGITRGLRYKTVPYIGRRVTLRAKSKISFGSGNSIGHNCYIDALSVDGISFGDHVSLGRNSKIECTGNLQYLGKGLTVGNNVGLGSDNFFGCAGGISIDDDTIIGNFVSFHAENHNYGDLTIPIRLQGVTHKGISIGKNCWIGAKSTILDGVIIEEGCIIAAGAIVKSGIYKKNAIYGGVPAKFIQERG